MKKGLVYLFIIFVLAISVFAYSKNKGLEWLNDNADWSNGQIEENSFALLALKSNNYDTKSGYDVMLQRKDPDNCYPKGNCNVKDTAIASLALKSLGYDTKPLIEWLNSALTRASVTNWYVQIKTDKVGNCTLSYDKTHVKEVFVNGTQKLKLDNLEIGHWINIETNLGAILDNPIEKIKVDCTEVDDPNLIISLLRITQTNDFYMIQESKSNLVNLIINNACYPISPGGSCNEESSFYAAYALKGLGAEVEVIPYLLDKTDTNIENAMMYFITNDKQYLGNLIKKQNPLGYWDNENIYVTSFSINSLKKTDYRDELANATAWLKSKQITNDLANNGSFGSVLDTSVALYLALTEISISPDDGGGGSSSFCGNNITEFGEECDDGNLVNGDNCNSICRLEDRNVCKSNIDCLDPDKPVCNKISGVCESTSIACNNDGFCDFGETNENCASDCKIEVECSSNSDCINPDKPICNKWTGVCEEEAQEEKECTKDSDCKNSEKCDLETNKCVIADKKFGVLFWASLVIIIAILIVGGYFAYKKFFYKKNQINKKPPYFLEESKKQPKDISRPSYPRSSFSRKTSIDDSLERELDKSIREAERLLKK